MTTSPNVVHFLPLMLTYPLLKLVRKELLSIYFINIIYNCVQMMIKELFIQVASDVPFFQEIT